MNPEIYQKLLENEAFLNDCWNSHNVTTKIEILQKSGWDLENEWKRHITNINSDKIANELEKEMYGNDHDVEQAIEDKVLN